ncbi:preprotein translocase subunit SecY [Actinoallomurus iriomotensis]|uniref:Protein translocase subunit SecY n=1 Tax=Actinoallomurus iriomotensis TaxID=478107 RepID=A0A9W6VT25_9ACTN|nr:preprotein translocase subunit SecY [Actinoallomurus iriomotensis]GLY79295.1 protein translocase subunit SecY [Actinoallomurus iriomotensis]
MSGFLRVSGLRAKFSLTVLAVVLYRLGQNLPSPGVDVRALRAAADAAVRDDRFYGLIDMLSGGGLLRLSVLGLGVFPYVAASVVVQLLVVTVPRMRALAAAGGAGAARIQRYVRILAVVMGALMGTAVAVAAAKGRLPGGDVLAGSGVGTVLAPAGAMTAGTLVTTWLMRLISSRGLGDGLAVLFFVQLAAVFPDLLWRVRQEEGTGAFAATTAAVLVSVLLVIVAVLVLDRAERRVPIQYARRMIGVRRFGGAATYVPLRLDHAGLVPAFTMLALLHLPGLAARLWPGGGRPDGLWTSPDQGSVWFMVVLFVSVAVLSVLSSAGAVDPARVADRLKREGAFVPGIRPGRPTADYLGYVRLRVTAGTPFVLGLVAVLPSAALALAGDQPFVTGTCVLLLAGAGLRTAGRIADRWGQHI